MKVILIVGGSTNEMISLKCFQKYIDVLKDKDDSTLSEQEKIEEREKVKNGQKSAFGDNFKWFPSWDNS